MIGQLADALVRAMWSSHRCSRGSGQSFGSAGAAGLTVPGWSVRPSWRSPHSYDWRGTAVKAFADRARDPAVRGLRAFFLALANRPALGQLGARLPLTRALVRRFIAGETLQEAIATLAKLRRAGFHTTIDLLGELTQTTEGIAETRASYVEAIRALAAAGLDVNVSLKPSQFGIQTDPGLSLQSISEVATAAGKEGFVRLDMEDHRLTQPTLDLAADLRRRSPNVGVVLQAYLRRTADDLEPLIREGVRVRLCKGAYNEPHAIAFASKAEVDASYERLMLRLLEKGNYPALATHDPALIEKACTYARERAIDPSRFEFQMLLGIRPDLQASLARSGYTVRVYVPYGADWYPYFMRRLAERPANVAFILRNLWPN